MPPPPPGIVDLYVGCLRLQSDAMVTALLVWCVSKNGRNAHFSQTPQWIDRRCVLVLMFDTSELKHMSDPIVWPPCCAHIHLRNLDDSIDEAALKEPDFSVFSVKLILIFRKPIAAGVLWTIWQSSPLHHWDGPKEKQAEGRDLNYACRLMSAHPTITALRTLGSWALNQPPKPPKP